MSVFKIGETMTLLGDILKDIDAAIRYLRAILLLYSLLYHYRMHKLLEKEDVRKAVEEYEKTRKLVVDTFSKIKVTDLLL
ncbi:hypothetical protein DRO02_01880 [archaeon]|nr:MAG: hypothetical protein DRO21_05025 [archaeon]RLG65429.1 MAG: hypothetical protein DRO02_01880 [archaeon]HDM23703.1 hypothetical protein [Candidatus Bathyarchaeota archaeon]